MSEKEEQLSFETEAAAPAPPSAEATAKPPQKEVAPVETAAPAEAAPEEDGVPAGTADAKVGPSAPDKIAVVRRDLIKPGKIFYKMGDVCDITGLEAHVLRFWEAEFEQLQPKKNRSGHRIYTVEEIERVICIRRLLHEEGYTIPGARKKLEDPAYESGENHGKPREMQFILNEISGIRKSLESAIKLLDGP
ncbi:MerR family transcriptional regulator [Acanthopleuribacter pedis]